MSAIGLPPTPHGSKQRHCRSSLSTRIPVYSSRAESGDWQAASLISTASSSQVSTSCKRTVPTRLDGRSPAGSNAFDGPLLGWPSASALRTTHSAFFGHPEVIPARDIRFEFERDEIALA